MCCKVCFHYFFPPRLFHISWEHLWERASPYISHFKSSSSKMCLLAKLSYYIETWLGISLQCYLIYWIKSIQSFGQPAGLGQPLPQDLRQDQNSRNILSSADSITSNIVSLSTFSFLPVGPVHRKMLAIISYENPMYMPLSYPFSPQDLKGMMGPLRTPENRKLILITRKPVSGFGGKEKVLFQGFGDMAYNIS